MNVHKKTYNFVSLVSNTCQKCMWISTMSLVHIRRIKDVSEKY